MRWIAAQDLRRPGRCALCRGRAAAWWMRCDAELRLNPEPSLPIVNSSAPHVFTEDLRQASSERSVLGKQRLPLVQEVIENLKILLWLFVGGQVS